ncbi:MAG: hydrogenase 3 maturation endopeptidase HyCI [Candidatus Xenobiia bacterium LiM19]
MLTDDVIDAITQSASLLLITVGNDLRGDDGVGPYIAENLSPAGRDFFLIDAGERPENILDSAVATGAREVIIIDAADFGGSPGEARLFEIEAIPETTLSTHTFPLPVIARLMEKDMRCRVRFLGIQAATFAFGAPLSEAVKETADELVALRG